jgi:hypothetical protein
MSKRIYNVFSRLPNLREGVKLNFSDIDLNVQRQSSSQFDEIPRVKFDRNKTSFYLDSFVFPHWNNERMIFQKIFESIEYSSFSNDPLAKQIQRLALRLCLYQKCETVNGFAIDPRDYLKLSLQEGPEFTTWLSKVRAAAIIKSLSSISLEGNVKFIEETFRDPYHCLRKKEKYDYDSFLNERFLIDFEETGNDFHWAFQPVKSDPLHLELFREAARKLLTSYKLADVKEASEEEFAGWISDSITIESDGPVINRILVRKQASEGKLDGVIRRSTEIRNLNFKRQVVQVDPGNVRDTWQCNLESLFVIKRVSHILRQVLEPIPYSAMCSPRTLLKRKKILNKKDGSFFMFDIKKCGLTVNRELLLIIGEELEAIYPGKGFSEMASYGKISVSNDGYITTPDRGVGMGNCNEGVTLIQCIMGFMMKMKYGISSLFFNDDGVFFSEGNERIPFTAILTLFNRLGMIINLEKTCISKFNIFCEDYVTDESLDYRKLQTIVVPFADIFFKKNIVSAKHLYNTLERSLIGRQAKVEVLDSVLRYWGIEFHRMEIYLPFEFGGWRYFGRTNCNEVLRFLFDPRYFLDSEGQSYIPYMREWMGFLVQSKLIKQMNEKGCKIPFPTFVPNPYKSWETSLGDFDFGKEVFNAVGLELNDSIRGTLDSLYNNRGAKNAKPKLKAGFLEKILLKRQTIWKKFKRVQGRYLVLESTPGLLKTALEFLREEEFFPNNYVPPDFMILGLADASKVELHRLGRLVVPTQKVSGTESSRWGLNCLIRSLYLQYIVKDTEIFSLSDEISKSKSGYILSDEPLYDGLEQIKPPPWVYLFLPKRDYARLLYINIYNCKAIPTGWMDFPSNREIFDMAINPIKHIFPESFKRFQKIKKICSTPDLRNYLSGAIASKSWYDRDEFELGLDLIEEDLSFLITIPPAPNERPEIDCTFLEYLERDEDLAETLVGLKDFDDLLEDFIYEEENEPLFLQESEDSLEDESIPHDVYEDIIDAETPDQEIENPDRLSVTSLQLEQVRSEYDY